MNHKWAVVSVVINSLVPQITGNFLTRWESVSICGRTLYLQPVTIE